MTCDLEKKYIYIYKGDDTNWNNEQFLTVNVTSEAVDLSTMTAKFILGSYSQTFPLTEGSFKVDLTHAVTGTYAYGPINGVIQILDSEQRIKTVSNTIPFYITNKVIAAQDETYNVEVPEGSPIDIKIDIGFGDVKWGAITGNINDQLDLKAALYSKVSKVGDTMTGNLVMDDAAVDFGNFKVSTDDGLAKIEGTQYGLRVDTTSGLGAALLTTRGLGEVLTTLDVKDTYSGNSSDPISGKGVAQAISTKQDTLTAAQLTAVNSGIDSAKVAQIATNTQAISNEVLARQSADNGLQTQIDALSAASDVKDIVGTYAELQAYDTSKLGNNDIIKVLTDETHEGAPSYYRWSTATQTFTYIGSESASYTKAQADAKFETITDAAQTYATKSELTTGLATKASNADGTTIVDNGSTISTVAVKEQNNALAIKEWVGTKAQYEAIVTKDANTLYTITDDPDTQTIVVDSALSSTSENPVQNKAIYNALQNIDALPSQTGQSGKYLTTDGTTASWGTVPTGGIQNESSQTGAIAIGGHNTTVGTNKGTLHTILIGDSAAASDSSSSNPSVTIGYNARGNNGGVTVGRSANSDKISSTYNTAVGNRSQADNNSVAVGSNASAYTNAVAIGGSSSSSDKTNANGDKAIAIGSKAVANGAGTIQIGTGTNSTAGTVQIGSYPLLDASGKIYSARLPSGGGAPTLTWYTGQTGNTVTIPDTTGASLVKVYKNGLLLRQGVARTNYNFTGGQGKFLTLSQTAPLHTANSWYYKARFLASSTKGSNGAFFGFAGESDNQAPSLIYYEGTNNLRPLLGSTGTNWDINVANSNISISANTTYDFIFGFNGSTYYIDTKLSSAASYNRGWSLNSNKKVYCVQPLEFLNTFDGTTDIHYNGATIYMKYTKIVIDGATWFDGATAVLGTDYTNTNCTAETVNACTNDYCVSGTTLTLAEDLFGTDEIAVEIY